MVSKNSHLLEDRAAEHLPMGSLLISCLLTTSKWLAFHDILTVFRCQNHAGQQPVVQDLPGLLSDEYFECLDMDHLRMR